MSESIPRIVVTSGEPAGIGPDICCLVACDELPARLAIAGDPDAMRERAAGLGLALDIVIRDSAGEVDAHRAGRLQLLPFQAARPVEPGRLDPANAPSVVEMLRAAGNACLEGRCDALVTAPVQKSVINEAGIEFTGHTEFLAELTGAPHPVMMLAGPALRVALATTHLRLSAVAAAITRPGLERLLRTLASELRAKLAIEQPRLLVLGLNPHAGENGVLGDEEITTIRPVIEALRAEGLAIAGPVPADTAFTPERLAGCDVVVAMYHDQGLPVLKASGFGSIVNVTLGLPIIRTSVDHGTALDIAGSGRARPESLRAAIDLAIDLAARARR